MIPDDRREAAAPLEIELLIPEHKRRITVDDHLAFRESIEGLPKRKLKDANRVIELLDELERSGE